LWFLGGNLLTTNTRRPIKGSKDTDFRLVFKKKKQKISPWGWGQWSGNVGQKKPKPTPIMT